MLYYTIYPYKKWQLLILASPKGLRSIDLYHGEDVSIYQKDDHLLKPYIHVLDNYFKGLPFPKDLDLDLNGTPFQQKVWHALIQIPFGHTTTYKEIANQVGRPKSYRAVGNAVGRNPILLAIPCHRVIRSDGALGGFSSDINLKIDLLSLEKK